MSIFDDCWQNWLPKAEHVGSEELEWLHQLNKAALSGLENNLVGRVKVTSVPTPAFVYHTSLPGCLGTQQHTACVSTYQLRFQDVASLDEHVDCCVKRLQALIEGFGARTAFFYSPVVPYGAEFIDGAKNRKHMCVRVYCTGETVEG